MLDILRFNIIISNPFIFLPIVNFTLITRHNIMACNLALHVMAIKHCFGIQQSHAVLQIRTFRMAGDFLRSIARMIRTRGWLAFSKELQWGSWGEIAKKKSILKISKAEFGLSLTIFMVLFWGALVFEEGLFFRWRGASFFSGGCAQWGASILMGKFSKKKS